MSFASSEWSRRAFVTGSFAAGSVVRSAPAPAQGTIPRRALGGTGETVSALGMGGFHIGQSSLSPAESTRLIHAAVDGGITFMDNCWDYNGGESERRMGAALREAGYRQRVFLMTKLDGRTKAAAARQLDDSLQRLQTGHIDLVQMHEVIRMSDPEAIFAAGGALEALTDARKAGKLRFIGFTGHKSPEIHLHMLQAADAHGFRFDTVQMPLNVMDAHYDSFTRRVIPVAQSKQMGILAMKTFGDHHILDAGAIDPIDMLHYGMSLPVSVVITGIDSAEVLAQALRAGRTFAPLSNERVAAILARTAPLAAAGKYELYKTTTNFDGTTHNPQWLD